MAQSYTHRPTHAVVNLGHYRYNLRAIQKRIGKKRGIIAVVKAQAYGHGMLECARAALEEGIRWLGVATVDEALTLRQQPEFTSTRILVMGPTFPADAEDLVQNRIDVAVGTVAVARALDKASQTLKPPAHAHLKIDTGMGRFGFWHEELPAILKTLRGLHAISWQALMTHFSESDIRSKTYTRWQIANFERVVKRCADAGFKPAILHAANSGAILQHPAAYYDLVRPGIMSYGMLPDIQTQRTIPIKPVITLLTRIINVREYPAGRYLSYGRTYQTKRSSRIGILPLGYGDGYPRHLSNCGYVMTHGKRAPVRGRVCMDQVLIDITQIPEAHVGSEVVVYGRKGANYVPIEDVARLAGTITYEITCDITPRVPRVYVGV